MAEGRSAAGCVVLLQRFVSLQAELVKAWLHFHPEALDPWAYRRLPRHGEIFVRGESWHFHRHGVGVDFQGQESRRMVDVHRAVGEPQTFDAWRLMLYFESLNVSSVRVGARDFPTDDERSLEQWLLELETLGLVVRDRVDVRLWKLAPTN
ncbi:DUF6896 domain-containing protein [Hyalangium versicolor]|uniref:DUF6896 domain-containing protein n=1 Tax=Hyalangium versicolor TaxID=2861190 RepID=UPI001CCAEF7E|nr:hypothetical protein [Hyalangium versicolor]